MTYQFANGHKIDEEAIKKALNDHTGVATYFFDTETGEVSSIAITATGSFASIEKAQRYFQIYAVPIAQKITWIKAMTEMLYEPEDVALREALQTLCAGDIEDMERYTQACTLIANDKNRADDMWAIWLGDHLWGEMEEFLYHVDPRIEDVWDFEDDCAVCDAMHSATERGHALSENELRAAFATAQVFNDTEQKHSDQI